MVQVELNNMCINISIIYYYLTLNLLAPTTVGARVNP